MTDPTAGLVASRRGVRVDTETGWSSVVATDADDCDRLAAAFTAMAARLRERPDVVATWDKLTDLDVGDAARDDIPEAMVRADEREQLAEAGRLLPDADRFEPTERSRPPLPPYTGDQRRHALAFNALSGALSAVDRFVSLSERQYITTVVLNAVDGDQQASAVGRCGDLAPSISHAPRQSCILPSGHPGWHRGDGYPFPAEWGEVEVAAGRDGTDDRACPSCARPGVVNPDLTVTPHNVLGLTSPCDAQPSLVPNRAPRFQVTPLTVDGTHSEYIERFRGMAAALNLPPAGGLCGAPGEYWPTGNIRIDLEPCDRPAGHDGKHHWPTPAKLPPDLPPPVNPD
ncbi:hypothetical protein [Verrucosispora sp. NA02020]|uniref:hypothetical protein n=1 Tax=Verrucosispora sp. NA02020 TaxID=2742132 RepID=UPI00159116E5|nr:hypothetical protein [Verrucosispora sp. NA02020]QKW15356.1 hypothetical protein HUT12_23060 [Verrucosispora sp. NA02020]